MKNLSTLILAFFVCFSSYAQITTDEQPISFNPAVGLALRDNAADVKTLPGLDMSQLEQEDKKDEANGLPPGFGFPHKVNLNLRNSGVWTVLPNGDKIGNLVLDVLRRCLLIYCTINSGYLREQNCLSIQMTGAIS
jgi:lysyl endopeptidase